MITRLPSFPAVRANRSTRMALLNAPRELLQHSDRHSTVQAQYSTGTVRTGNFSPVCSSMVRLSSCSTRTDTVQYRHTVHTQYSAGTVQYRHSAHRQLFAGLLLDGPLELLQHSDLAELLRGQQLPVDASGLGDRGVRHADHPAPSEGPTLPLSGNPADVREPCRCQGTLPLSLVNPSQRRDRRRTPWQRQSG
eukprot:886978-Pyramimonas_sp.AAC.1